MGFNQLILFYYDFHGKNKHFKTENITDIILCKLNGKQ